MLDFKDKQLLFVDFETFYDRKGSYDLRSMSMTEYIRDPRFKVHGVGIAVDMGPATWSTSVPADIRWDKTVVVAHNVKFDGAILAWRYGVQPYAWFDTAGLARATLGEMVSGFSLKTIAEYLGLPPKGELSCDGVRDPSTEQLATLGEYCKHDVELCQSIFKALMPKFPQFQLWHMDWTIRAFIDARLTLNTELLAEGVANEKKRKDDAFKKMFAEEKDSISAYLTHEEREWYDSFETHDGPFVPVIATEERAKKLLSSNQQLAAYMQWRGNPVATKTSLRTGKQIPALGKSDEGVTALPETLRDARLAAKSTLLETRGASLLAVGRTGNYPFDVNFSGAVQTHRYSGGSGAGGNPQNFTRGSFLRGAVSAPPGQVLVVGDFAAIELRVLAWLAREPKLLNGIVNGLDLYSAFASPYFGREITKAHKPERHFGKCAILGLGYGMGAKKFFATAKALRPTPDFTPEQVEALRRLVDAFTEADAEKAVELYRTTYFNVPKLWQCAEEALPLIANGSVSCLHFAPFVKVRKNAIVLPSGLEVRYPNLRQEKQGRWIEWVYDIHRKRKQAEPSKLYGGKFVENLCQALAGELCKMAIERIEADGIPCVGQVHDEVIAIWNNAAEGKRCMEAAMSRPPTWWPELRLKCEVGTGGNWSDAKS